MSCICELTSVGVLSGNNVSHSNRKTKRVFLPNIHKKRFYSFTLGMNLSFRVTPNAMKSVDHKFGIDNYLLSTKDTLLSKRARKIKKVLQKKPKDQDNRLELLINS